MSKKKKGKVLKWIIIAIVLLLIIGGIIFGISMKNANKAPRALMAGYVKKDDLQQYVNMTGTVSGSNSVNVTGEMSLKVKTLNVKVGDNIKEGDILCIFDSTSLQEEFDELSESNSKTQGAANYSHGINQRNLEQARRDKASALSQAQQDIDDATSKRDEAYNNYNDKVQKYNDINKDIDKYYNEMMEADDEETSKTAEAKWMEAKQQAETLNAELNAEHTQLSAYDDAVNAAKKTYDSVVKSADDMIQTAQDTIDQEEYKSDDTASAKLKKLSEQIEKCTVRAPISGVVTQLNISEGTIPQTSNIMTISDASSLIVKGKVDESDILNVSEGMKVEITTNATEDEIISGKVSRIERISSADAGESSNGYNVEISVTDKDSDLLIGMSASAKIILDEVTDVLCVPYDSIISEGNGECYVWVASDNGDGTYTLSKKLIETGFEGDYYTEVTSGDIKEKETVITNASNVSEGDIVSLEISEE